LDKIRLNLIQLDLDRLGLDLVQTWTRLSTDLNQTSTDFDHRLEQAIRVKKKWGHLTGTTARPTAVDPAKPTDDERTKMSDWDEDEATARYLLAQRIPDSTLIQTRTLATSASMWSYIVAEFTTKSAFAQSNLRREFINMRVPQNGDLCTIFDSLATKRETLLNVELQPPMRTTYLRSCSPDLAVLSFVVCSACFVIPIVSESDAKPTASITRYSSRWCFLRYHSSCSHCHILDEWDRCETERVAHESNKRKNKSKDSENVAFSAESSNKSDKKKFAPRGACWNCGERRHHRAACKKPKKADGSSKKESGSANIAVESDSDEGCWVALEISDLDDANDSLSNHESESVFDLEWDSGNEHTEDDAREVDFDSIIELYSHEDLDDASIADLASFRVIASCVSNLNGDGHVLAILSRHDDSTEMPMAILDTGATQHLLSCKDAFLTYSTIAPKTFRSASQNSFEAVGSGDLTLKLPCGLTTNELRLTDVLYSPDIGYTLISVGKLDDAGFSVKFKDGKCYVYSPNNALIGEITKSSCGLYRINIELPIRETALASVEHVTPMQLHCHLGHLSIHAARRMLQYGHVDGLVERRPLTVLL
jgi:hypothetical protein